MISTSIDKKIKTLSRCFEREATIRNDVRYDLLGGKAGEIYFKHYYGKYREREFSLEEDLVILSSRLSVYPHISGSLSGLAGVYTLLKKMQGNYPASGEVDKFTRQLEMLCLKSLRECLRQRNFDFLHGATGLVHALATHRTCLDKAIPDYVEALYALYGTPENLLRLSRYNDRKSIYEFTEGYSNSSLAHGISGILVVLSKLYALRVEPVKCRQVCENLISLLPAFALNGKDSLYANLLPNPDTPTRLAWCVGDMGIANALWQAGSRLLEPRWQEVGVAIMVACAKRVDRQVNQVYDAGICHGTAGIAHLFLRFGHATREPLVEKAAEFWLKETLKSGNSTSGYGGYLAWQGAEGWKQEYGLLEGIAGIGLCLLGFQDESCMDWDDCLLMS